MNFYSFELGSSEKLFSLIKDKDINIRDEINQTALHLAVRAGNS